MTTTADIASALAASDSIDPAFPIAGQDNNSQGFRDNFSYTQTSLDKVVTVLTDFNNNVARTDTDNNFHGVRIENAETNMLYGAVLTVGTASTYTIDTRDAEYFGYTLTSSATLTFAQWPISDRYAKVIVDVKSDGTSRTLNFATTSGSIIVDSGLTLPATISADATVRHVYEAWTVNGGNTVFVRQIGTFS